MHKRIISTLCLSTLLCVPLALYGAAGVNYLGAINSDPLLEEVIFADGSVDECKKAYERFLNVPMHYKILTLGKTQDQQSLVVCRKCDKYPSCDGLIRDFTAEPEYRVWLGGQEIPATLFFQRCKNYSTLSSLGERQRYGWLTDQEREEQTRERNAVLQKNIDAAKKGDLRFLIKLKLVQNGFPWKTTRYLSLLRVHGIGTFGALDSVLHGIRQIEQHPLLREHDAQQPAELEEVVYTVDQSDAQAKKKRYEEEMEDREQHNGSKIPAHAWLELYL